MPLEAQAAPQTPIAPAEAEALSRPFRRPIQDIDLSALVLTKINVRKHKDKEVVF